MSGAENTEPSNQPTPGDPAPGTPPAKAVFSDAFDAHSHRQDGDELPEYEPLTAEHVEDEAIRGDFMLRWATILLAVLMAFGRMNDTKPLVLIKSGDVMRANGFLPASTDQFSHTVEGKPVTNVSWLFDHVISLAWLIGGHAGLTILKASIAALSAWLLLRISVPGISTWWSSVCAIFAVVACSSDYWPLPEIVTILGVTLVMRFLFQHRIGTAKGLGWKLPLLIAVWCNFDSHAWVGVGIVFAYALGVLLTRRIRLNRDATAQIATPGLSRTAIFCVLALLVNPSPVASLFSPLTTYSIEYPAMQSQRSVTSPAAANSHDGRVDFVSVLNPAAMILFDHAQIAALAVLLAAFVVLVVSRTIRDLSLWCCLVFVTALILMAAHELPAASIVAAAVGGIVAQEWYRRSFSMKYSVDSKELLFSRGGRAATVLALAGIGFCVVTSRLPGSVPLGLGFDEDTRITMDAFAAQVKSLPADARILHTRMEHGDLLIWHGRKSFVDSRVIPFGRVSSKESVAGQHRNLLRTLMLPEEPEPETQDPEVKKEHARALQESREIAAQSLNDFKISHAMVRLSPPGRPDYDSMQLLQSSPSERWFLVSIGAAVGVMERSTPTTTLEDVTSRSPNLRKLAFQTEVSSPPGSRPFALPPSVYDKYVYRTRVATSADKREGRNFLFLAELQPQNMVQVVERMSAAVIAIRYLNKALTVQPDDAETFEMLFRAYRQLGMMEEFLVGGQALPRVKQLRYSQSIIACHQALICDPENLAAWDGLASTFQELKRMDLCRDALANWVRVAQQRPEFEVGLLAEELIRREQTLRDMTSQLETVRKQFSDAMEKQREQFKAAPRPEVPQADPGEVIAPNTPSPADIEALTIAINEASAANSGGLPRTGLDILRQNQAMIANDPYGASLLGNLMLEAGDLNDAATVLPQLKLMAQSQPEGIQRIEWQMPVATLDAALCNYSGAAATWSAQAAAVAKQYSTSDAWTPTLLSLPLVADVNFGINQPVPTWPLRNTTSMTELVQASTEARAELMMLTAVMNIEEGSLKPAQTVLKSIIEDLGDTTARPLAIVYYSLMADDKEAQELLQSLTVVGDEEYLFPGEKLPDPPKPEEGDPNQPPATPAP